MSDMGVGEKGGSITVRAELASSWTAPSLFGGLWCEIIHCDYVMYVIFTTKYHCDSIRARHS